MSDRVKSTLFQAALDRADVLLIDFDGPICSVFAGLPADKAAQDLREIWYRHDLVSLPAAIEHTSDPFAVLLHSMEFGGEIAREIEDALTNFEVSAVKSSRPTPGAYDLIQRWHLRGRKLGIVSNNSRVAINEYLGVHGLESVINIVSARTATNVAQLKPRPKLLFDALEFLDTPAHKACFIGDSDSDIKAGRRAGVFCIGYANSPEKFRPFTDDADLCIESMMIPAN